MSQNKTVVAGGDFESSNMTNKALDMSFYDQLYHQSPSEATKSTMDSGKTVLNDVHTGGTSSGAEDMMGVLLRSIRNIKLQDRMVVGILFSVSKNVLGELFPIYLGINRIGSNTINDVCLSEQTISFEHAILHVRRNPLANNKLEVSLIDYSSQGTTMVEDKDVMFEPAIVSDGNIISIGKHYKFVFKLFDVESRGLYNDPSLMSTEANTEVFLHKEKHNPIGDTPVSDDAFNEQNYLEDIYSSDSCLSDNTSKTVLI